VASRERQTVRRRSDFSMESLEEVPAFGLGAAEARR
jgi:hypothetical protein